MTSRAAFEAWLNPGNHAGNVSPWVEPGRYEKESHQLAWLAWQAAGLRAMADAKPIGYWGGEFTKDGGADLYEVPQESCFGRVYKNLPLYATPQRPQWVGLTDESINAAAETAWRAGWAACRDAEFAGQEAEDDEWGMNGANVCKDVESDLRAKNGGA